MSSTQYQRPAFWKAPQDSSSKRVTLLAKPITTSRLVSGNKSARRNSLKKRVHFEDEQPKVQLGSPAYGEVLRGDVISKIGEYDARDLRHSDAQHLFRSAGNEIKIVVHRDSKIAYIQGVTPCNSPEQSNSNQNVPHRGPSPFLPGPGQYERALNSPVDTLPHTVFPKLNPSGGYVAPLENARFSPMPSRDHQQDVAEEQATIVNQVSVF